VSGSTELPIETLNELKTDLPRLGAPLPFTPTKVKSTQVWKWPEWQAFAARLGIRVERVTECVVHLNCRDVARVSVTYVGEDHSPCPTHPAATHHTASSQAPSVAETTPTPATSADTPSSGTHPQTHG
jgi:hypothetical protein